MVGWAVSAVNDRHLVLAALTMAVNRRRPETGLLHDSDRGSTYASEDYQRRLDAHGIMSRTGDCYDNAVRDLNLAKNARFPQRTSIIFCLEEEEEEEQKNKTTQINCPPNRITPISANAGTVVRHTETRRTNALIGGSPVGEFVLAL